MEAGGNGSKGVMTRGKRKREEKAQKEGKRRKTLFQPSKVVGPLDILVNQGLGKISLGVNQDVKPVVKLEETGDGQGQDEVDDGMNIQDTEVVHVVKLEDIEEMQDTTGDESLWLEGTGGGIEKILREEIRLLKDETVSIKATNKQMEERAKELEARVAQLENRGEMELKALIDRKLSECGIKPQIMQITSSSNLNVTEDDNLNQANNVPDVGKGISQTYDKAVKLFPEVAEIMWDKFGKTMLSSSDFLNARLVCASWSQGIEKIAQGPCHVLHEKRILEVNMCCWKHTNEVVNDRKAGLPAQTSLKIIQTNHACPDRRRPRCSEPSSTDEWTWAACKRKLTELLAKQGGNIQKAYFPIEYYTHIAPQNPLVGCSEVMDLLVLMPNLKLISLKGEYKYDHSIEWLRLFDVQSFPKLSYLQHFESLMLPLPLTEAVLGSNNHITSMNISLPDLELLTGTLDVFLPQLKELHVSELLIPREGECLLGLSAPSLQVLKLSGGTYVRNCETVDGEIIYKLLEHFQTTLVELEMNCKIPILKGLPEMLKLRRLKIYLNNVDFMFKHQPIQNRNVCWCQRNLNQWQEVLASVPVLEYLEFSECKCFACNLTHCSCLLETNAQRYKFVKTNFVSKLWDLLPKLHHVKFKSWSFVRAS